MSTPVADSRKQESPNGKAESRLSYKIDKSAMPVPKSRYVREFVKCTKSIRYLTTSCRLRRAHEEHLRQQPVKNNTHVATSHDRTKVHALAEVRLDFKQVLAERRQEQSRRAIIARP
jgi:hypothetical protein